MDFNPTTNKKFPSTPIQFQSTNWVMKISILLQKKEEEIERKYHCDNRVVKKGTELMSKNLTFIYAQQHNGLQFQ